MQPDAAVVDINLGDGPSFAAADLLLTAGVPFVFATGYSEMVPDRFAAIPLLIKPFPMAELVEVLHRLCTPS